MKTSRIDEKDKIIMMIFENNEKLKLYFANNNKEGNHINIYFDIINEKYIINILNNILNRFNIFLKLKNLNLYSKT